MADSGLARFTAAQDDVVGAGSAYSRALDELRAGFKRSHWMWFVFPQVRGLGTSRMSVHYGIEGLGEARAYLEHAVLGSRLRECCQAVLEIAGRTAEEILGDIDAVKLCSCMTLFDEARPRDVFAEVLDRYDGGQRDPLTLAMLEG